MWNKYIVEQRVMWNNLFNVSHPGFSFNDLREFALHTSVITNSCVRYLGSVPFLGGQSGNSRRQPEAAGGSMERGTKSMRRHPGVCQRARKNRLRKIATLVDTARSTEGSKIVKKSEVSMVRRVFVCGGPHGNKRRNSLPHYLLGVSGDPTVTSGEIFCPIVRCVV